MPFYDHSDRVVFCRGYQLFPDYPARSMWHCATMGAHAKARPDWGICHHGQGFLLHYVLRGRGWVTTHEQRFCAAATDVIFLDCHEPYELTVDPRNPWEFYDVLFDSAIGHHWIEHLECDRCPVFHVPNPGRMRRLFQRINCLPHQQPPGFEGQISALIHQIATDLFTQKAKKKARGLGPSASKSREYLLVNAPLAVKKALDRIQVAYHRRLSVSEIVATSGVSRSHLYTLFEKHLNKSPMSCLCDYRIHHAKELLAHTNLPVKNISVHVGIEDANYFSRLFLRKIGIGARQYRAQTHRRWEALSKPTQKGLIPSLEFATAQVVCRENHNKRGAAQNGKNQ